mmetsp:Transcript_4605/g.7242  ORF Transcript_4605/g.7242 Transcript_4605/m.7242 type:complete len:571 (+) Transcript_4605:210-1922(+)
MASMTRAAAAVQTPAAAASTSARRSAARFTGGYAGAQRHRHIRQSFVGGVAGARCQTCHVFGRSRGEPASLPLFLRRPSSPSANAASTGGGGGARQRRLTVTAAVVEPGSVVRGRSPAANVGEPVNVTEKVGILLLNLGGPEELDDVQPFLYNLFADPDIIRLPAAVRFLQSPLAALLSNSRAPKSRKAYESIGGGSPLRRITDEQAQALKQSLAAKGQAAEVYVGMRYWKPFTEDATEQIKADGITQLVVLPLYPQFSISTSGSSLRLLEQIFSEDEYLQMQMKHTVIPSWYQRPGYVQAMADLIKGELNKPGSEFDSPDEPIIFFSAHGVPVSYVEDAGDPYKQEMEECVALIVAQLGRMGVHNEHVLAYQSRVGPIEWLKPYTDDIIRELGAKKTKAMVAVPISFVSEHIETLEEMDMEYRELAEESGVQQWGRVPALDTNPVFIDDLADAVVESLLTFENQTSDLNMGSGEFGMRSAEFGSFRSGDFGSMASGEFGSVSMSGGLPPISIMPMGTGTKASVPKPGDLGDLLGGGQGLQEPWEWGFNEYAMIAVSILLSTMLMMDQGM